MAISRSVCVLELQERYWLVAIDAGAYLATGAAPGDARAFVLQSRLLSLGFFLRHGRAQDDVLVDPIRHLHRHSTVALQARPGSAGQVAIDLAVAHGTLADQVPGIPVVLNLQH